LNAKGLAVTVWLVRSLSRWNSV